MAVFEQSVTRDECTWHQALKLMGSQGVYLMRTQSLPFMYTESQLAAIVKKEDLIRKWEDYHGNTHRIFRGPSSYQYPVHNIRSTDSGIAPPHSEPSGQVYEDAYHGVDSPPPRVLQATYRSEQLSPLEKRVWLVAHGASCRQTQHVDFGILFAKCKECLGPVEETSVRGVVEELTKKRYMWLKDDGYHTWLNDADAPRGTHPVVFH